MPGSSHSEATRSVRSAGGIMGAVMPGADKRAIRPRRESSNGAIIDSCQDQSSDGTRKYYIPE